MTAIASDPQANVDFYLGVLGLRLVKKTVNFDAPDTYHLYYGDDLGRPGTVLTFFPWTDVLFPGTARARKGTGQVVATAFAVPDGSLDYWVDRFAYLAVDFDVYERMGEEVIGVLDPDGMRVEIVASARGHDVPEAEYGRGDVPALHAIRGLAGVTISLAACEQTITMLTELFGFALTAEDRSGYRLETGAGTGTRIDLLSVPDLEPGIGGIGAVHHVALRAESDEQQNDWRRLLREAGYDVSPILDRQYFRSIYFRDRGGVLFEVATDAPGFAIDEPHDSLGELLTLPQWLEPRRVSIEMRLPPVRTPRPAASPDAGAEPEAQT